jgi:uncharacterized protein with ATP-grasp and redox domains
MKFVQECVDCSVRQAERTYNLTLARRGLGHQSLAEDPELLRELKEVLAGVPEHVSPAEISYYAIAWAMRKFGDPDPYAELKRASNEEALAIYEHLREMVEDSDDPLKIALLLSVVGNVIDLGIQREYDLDETLRHAMEKGFAIDRTEDLRDELSKAKRLLYCCDNAGEIVFDSVLIETIQRVFPRLQVTAVVKSRPVLNDALMEDARMVGLDQVCRVIESGYDKLGMAVEDLSEECRAEYENADVIISKGQANYESLEHRPENIFCILMAKCEIVADFLGVGFKEMVLTRGTGRL